MNTVFADSFRGPSWDGWRAILCATFGLPMSAKQYADYQKFTGRTDKPTEPFNEVWWCAGRRAGKSRVVALISVVLSAFHDWRPYLSPGERGVFLILAVDRQQSRLILRYARALLASVPALESMVTSETAESIDLACNVSIEVATSSYRSVRGRTVIGCVLEEVAFFRSDENSANVDRDILDALRPAMATIPNAMLLGVSSPYARRGVLWDAFKEFYGKDGAPVLVVKAPTRELNPLVPQRVIDQAYERDPAAASAEFGAEFRSDIAAFVSREVVDACVVPGRFELPFRSGVRYVGATDPSGGSADSMTLAIAHLEGGKAVLDLVREVRPPFGPDATAQEFASILKAYRIQKVYGDRYAGEWPRERFRVHGVQYALNELSASDQYRDWLAQLNSGECELLDHPRLIQQLTALERRTSRSGKDMISHPPSGHDDIVNSVSTALLLAKGKRAPMCISQAALAAITPIPGTDGWRRMQNQRLFGY
jgi:hypothetical protein